MRDFDKNNSGHANSKRVVLPDVVERSLFDAEDENIILPVAILAQDFWSEFPCNRGLLLPQHDGRPGRSHRRHDTGGAWH